MSSVNKTSGAPPFVRPLRKGWESTTLSPTVNTLIENALVNQPRGTQRYRPTQRDDEDTLTQAIVTLASQ